MKSIEVYEKHKEKYEDLIKIFQNYNSQINLSSFNDRENILNKHILDSLSIFEFGYWEQMIETQITRIFEGANYTNGLVGDDTGLVQTRRDPSIPQDNTDPNSKLYILNSKLTPRIADIGTGGGFPGLALAVALPGINFYLIDSIKKKCVAVEKMVNDLSLTNVFVINSRAEDLALVQTRRDPSIPQDDTYNAFDITLSRAVSEFGKIYKWSKDLTKKGGRMYFYKSLKESVENFESKTEYEIDGDKRAIYEFFSN
jgi:16S rRNA (guanine(527)-N(7))-methyltransferase RsmG